VQKKVPSLRRKWLRYLLLGAALLTVVVVCFLPEVISTGWHLVHGNSARFHNWEVPVPKGWWAFTAQGSLIVQEIHKSVDRDSEVIVQDLRLPAGITYNYEKHKTSSVEYMSKEGYRLVEDRKTRLAGEECFCLSFSQINNTERRRITCEVPNHRLFLSFVGDPGDATVFYSIIEHITQRAE
jgi:hypothetical protein